jgi:hypothetical protein
MIHQDPRPHQLSGDLRRPCSRTGRGACAIHAGRPVDQRDLRGAIGERRALDQAQLSVQRLVLAGGCCDLSRCLLRDAPCRSQRCRCLRAHKHILCRPWRTGRDICLHSQVSCGPIGSRSHSADQQHVRRLCLAGGSRTGCVRHRLHGLSPDHGGLPSGIRRRRREGWRTSLWPADTQDV